MSDHLLATLARSHTRRVYVDVLHDGRTVATLKDGRLLDPNTGQVANLIGGNIPVDKTTIRRSGTISFADVSGQLTPTDVEDLFAPFGTELRVWVGARYWDAPTPPQWDPINHVLIAQPQEEYVPCGTLIITDVQGTYPQLSFTTYDRMWLLGTFPAPFTIARGTDIISALSGLLAQNIPSSRLDLNLPAGSEHLTGALLYDVQASVADAAHDLATAAGLQLFCDQMGAFTATAEPSTDDPPVMTYKPGQFSMMMRPNRSTVGSGAYNAVVYTGEPADAPPVRGYAQDNDPSSLTYVGRMGTRIYYESSPVVRTTAQANLAAKTVLNRILGLADQVTVDILPNVAHDSGDVIGLSDPQTGISGPVIIDSFPVNLRATDGLMTLTCRNRVIR